MRKAGGQRTCSAIVKETENDGRKKNTHTHMYRKMNENARTKFVHTLHDVSESQFTKREESNLTFARNSRKSALDHPKKCSDEFVHTLTPSANHNSQSDLTFAACTNSRKSALETSKKKKIGIGTKKPGYEGAPVETIKPTETAPKERNICLYACNDRKKDTRRRR